MNGIQIEIITEEWVGQYNNNIININYIIFLILMMTYIV